VDDDLLATLGSSSRPCHHLHLSLQSGSDSVLARMNRGYTTTWYRERAEAIRKHWPDLGLTTDLIVGFPGETKQEFEQTLAFCSELSFAKVHVFPYSRRRGTSAWFFKNPLPHSEVKERARVLRAVTRRISWGFYRRFLGTVQEVLVEGQRDFILTGYTGQFIRVEVSGCPDPLTPLVSARITGVTPDGLSAVSEVAQAQAGLSAVLAPQTSRQAGVSIPMSGVTTPMNGLNAPLVPALR
jgi:threonylcarbamoyladenosine tRNA methylthiotransferase MtaB